MNSQILAVRDDLSVYELATFLTDHEISGAPVEDEAGELIGVVSVTDVVRAASEGGRPVDESGRHFYSRGWEEELEAEELEELESLHLEEEGLLVRDIMTPSVLAIQADAKISQIASSMLEGHIHRLLVIDGRKVVGIVSSSDLLQLFVEGLQ
jgi:CBS domain-containing protein